MREAASAISMLRHMAKQVMASLGTGHSERVYHRAMITLLNKKEVQHRSEVLTPIYFLGEVVGVGRGDLVIKNLVVELKAITRCPTKFSPQLRKYMTNMGAAEHRRFHGIIINFNQCSGAIEVLRDNSAPKKTRGGAAGKLKKRQRKPKLSVK